MKHYFIIFFLFNVLLANAQSGEAAVSGRISDIKGQEPLVGAVVQALNPKDSVAYNYNATITDSEGNFRLKVKTQKYILKLSSLGFEVKYIDIEPSKDNLKIDLGTISMKENSIRLNDAEIIGSIPPIVVKGDTIEYSANSYTNDENELLNDMLKRIPGIEVDTKGNITANGKPISKILVDGKEFFGNDIAMALNNLPANMIKKLQLFKEQSDESKVTGIKDKDPAQVLNLTVKDELKESIFGNIEAGLGNDDKYKHKLVANGMKNNNQLSVIGEMDNAIRKDSYLSEDGTMSMGSFGNEGIDKNKNIGVNFYNQRTKKLKLGGYFRYMKNENLLESMNNSYNFETKRYNKQQITTKNRNEIYNFGINLNWNPDTLTQIFLRSSLTLNNRSNGNDNRNMSYITDKDTTDGFSQSTSSFDGYSLNNNLMIGRQLGKNGRNISLMFYNTIRKDNGDGTNYSETNYPNIAIPKVIDQRIGNDIDNNNFSLSIAYTEPLKKDIKLAIKYAINNNTSVRDRQTWRKDDYGNYAIIDTAYTRYTKSKYLNQIIGTGLQLSKEKYDVNIGIDMLPTYSRSKSSLSDSLIENISQHVVNYSPNLNFSYKPNSTSNLDFNYYGNTNQPNINQLSTDTVIASAMMKSVGNPNLKMSYTNNVNFYYHKSDYETERFMMFNGGFNYTFNEIVDYTFVDDEGNTTQTYTNVNGNMGVNVGFGYNTPLRNKKFTLSSNSYANYYRRIGFTNAMKSISNNITLTQTAGIKFSNDKVYILLNANITHNIIKNSLEESRNFKYTNYGLKNELSIKLPYDFSIKSQINYAYYAGYESDFKKNELIWDASINKNLLKNKKGTISLQLYDILNNKNPLTRTVNGNDYSDYRINSVKRYVLLSFAYKFNIASKKTNTDVQEDEEIYY